MLQHITNDIGQVFLGDNLFLVAQLRDTLRDATGLLGGEFQTQFLKVLGDIGLPAIFTKGIFTFTTKTLWHQLVVVELVLGVAISMNTSHLSKYILTHNGLIGGHADATKALHHARQVVELTLNNAGLGMELILQNSLNRGQWGIATTLAQSVDGDMKTTGTTKHSCQRV